ncbi:M48 family metallopeptidase [Pelagicoccus albus]|uniref:M48 family metallopeptidase n=1 Tax=Pelagicoccus albus TaxID=415222 RepID=A0A7X1B5L4_9BACT|nr:SprT family zinc-dependent metalloprotease [Pelagicoccus albus]MBC2606083.1 M48 family metallopeptidase [Pelagicoccus albus]
MAKTISKVQTTDRDFSLRYGKEFIRFQRVSSNSKKAKATIKVHPDGTVFAHANDAASDSEVLDAVRKKARWIAKQRRYFAELEHGIRTRKFVSGESHFYLGRRYLLKVFVDREKSPKVRFYRGKIEVFVDEKSSEKVAGLLQNWYRERARIVLSDCLDEMTKRALWVRRTPSLRLRKMSKQWGNCSPNGVLTLNENLVKAPRECIEYVVLHELAHHAEHNHSKRFYRLLDQALPDWRASKTRLDSLGPAILER